MELHHKHLLFDFYGVLLTQHQQDCFTLFYSDDHSLSEIAEELDITPQAVSDMLKRTLKKLEQFEAKLGLVQRYTKQQEAAQTMRRLVTQVLQPLRGDILTQLDVIIKS
ncbi:MAG: hypothetical protein FWC71_01345 [Defluviitaleaceae bacterium]|nr:hypothetical protein [Defluviitaleaceae bacterium]